MRRLPIAQPSLFAELDVALPVPAAKPAPWLTLDRYLTIPLAWRPVLMVADGMSAASYRRGSQVIAVGIARDHGLHVAEDYSKARPLRSADHGNKARLRAEQKARGLVRVYVARQKPVPSVDDLAKAVESFARVGKETARAAATVALAEQE